MCVVTASSEPYFYDSAYQPVNRDYPIPVDEEGKCIVADEIKAVGRAKRWACTSECKPLTQAEVDAILDFKEAFEQPMHEVRHVLATCDDGCPNGHYCKVVASGLDECTTIERMGHPLVCSNDRGCNSTLRILR